MLLPIEEQIRTHALLCSIGFLILLPLGVLVARYLRTFTSGWWLAHGLIQFIISGPVIFAGWYYGHQSTSQLFTGGHYVDPHKKIGLSLLILYVLQLFIGGLIHFIKLPLPGGHRPPQNYFHAIFGLSILALAAYQVHYGIKTEWPNSTGNLHTIPQSATNAWIALITIFWVLYAAGLGLLPRQYGQERDSRVQSGNSSLVQSGKET